MRRLRDQAGRLGADQRGQMTVEWGLLLAVVFWLVVPTIMYLLAALGELYRMVTFMETLPFP